MTLDDHVDSVLWPRCTSGEGWAPTAEDFVRAAYRWIDDNCNVTILGVESLVSIDDLELLGSVIAPVSKQYTHKLIFSRRTIQDPSLEFATSICDGWSVGVRLLVFKGEVYQWLATESAPGIANNPASSYYLRHMPELNAFVAEAIKSSKNVLVWG
jgi:hypothetical protein